MQLDASRLVRALLLFVVAAPSAAQLGTGSATVLAKALGEPPAASDTFGRAVAFGDFDCDGLQDLAVGIPGHDAPGSPGPIDGAGAVRIFPGNVAGLSTVGITIVEDDLADPAGLSEPGDAWGTVLAAGNFDGDEVLSMACDDLVVGAPLEDAGATLDAGAIFVLYGDPAGLSTTNVQVFTQAGPEVQGNVEAGDGFGETLAVGDFDGDGFDDLAVGAPKESIGAGFGEGAVWALRGTAGGLTAPSIGAGDDWWQLFYQAFPEIADDGELGDLFGAALASCDIDDDGFDDLAIGVPGEDLGSGQGALPDAGAFHVLFGSAEGLSVDEDAFTPGGESEGELGAALVGGEFKNAGFFDRGCEIAVGVPGADFFGEGGQVSEVGRVDVHEPQRSGSGGAVFHSFDRSSIPGESPRVHGRFGEVLVAADFDGDGLDEVVVGDFREGGLLGGGAVFWYSLAERTGLVYRIGDLTTDELTMEDPVLGRVLAAGELGAAGLPHVAAGLPNLDRQVGAEMESDVGALLVVEAAPRLLRDGFESEDTSAWSVSVP